jgi:hypothetical protein
MKTYIIITVLFIIVATANADNMRSPEMIKNIRQPVPQSNNTLSRQYCYTFLKLYRYGLGKFIKSNCPMQPSCSHYSINAIKQYGLIRGVILTADRLLHETDEAEMVDKIWITGRGFCCLDPVSRNILWAENNK